MIKNKRFLLVALLLAFSFVLPSIASAAKLNQASIRLGRLGNGASTANDLLVTFKLNTTPTSVARISVSFPAGYTLTAGTPTPATTGFPKHAS